MMRVRLKYILEHRDRHGNWRVYVRRPGKPMVRLRATPDTPEFIAEYDAAVKLIESGGAPPKVAATAPPGSLRQLCGQYYGSAEYKGLAPSTRKVRRQIYDRICERDGAKPWARMEARHIRARRDEAADRPESANGMIKALRQLFTWAMEAVEAKSNPAKDVPYLRSGSQGFHTWTIDEVAKFEAKHPIGSKPRLALALLLYTGVRRGDAVKLGRQMRRGARLHFTEGKGELRNAKERAIPILPELQAVIDATPSGHLNYLTTSSGKPYSAGGFGNWFRRQCNAAGLAHCSAHGLRKAGATIAADHGATEHQLMAIFGWSTPKQAALYTRKANRTKLADDAMHLLAAGRSENEHEEIESPLPVVPSGDSKPPAKPLKKRA